MILLQSGMLTAAAFFFAPCFLLQDRCPRKTARSGSAILVRVWMSLHEKLHWPICLRRLLLQLGPSQPKEMPLAADFLHRQELG